jgi:hypothetical protein
LLPCVKVFGKSASLTTDIVSSAQHDSYCCVLWCGISHPIYVNKQKTTVKTKCDDNRLKNRSPQAINFIPMATPGPKYNFLKPGNFLEGGDAVS